MTLGSDFKHREGSRIERSNRLMNNLTPGTSFSGSVISDDPPTHQQRIIRYQAALIAKTKPLTVLVAVVIPETRILEVI